MRPGHLGEVGQPTGKEEELRKMFTSQKLWHPNAFEDCLGSFSQVGCQLLLL